MFVIAVFVKSDFAGNRLKRKMTEIHQYQIDVGRWFLSKDPDVFRLTWKGAFISGWQFAWPVNDVRKWLFKIRAKKVVCFI